MISSSATRPLLNLEHSGIGVHKKYMAILGPLWRAIAAVSHKFQAAIERQTFNCLHADTTKDELEQFEHILTPPRRDILRHLSLFIVLPSYPEELWDEFETDEDRRANSEAATAALGRVFRILAGNDSQKGDSITPVLTLEILKCIRHHMRDANKKITEHAMHSRCWISLRKCPSSRPSLVSAAFVFAA
ncbi:Protoheme IX farnesyltransferase, mitochondrial [Hypoxylon texense]